MKPKVLFLCTANSCRSQIAEAWANRLRGDRLEVWSAGTDPKAIDPFAVRAMLEHGIDISAARSKHVKDLLGIPFDYVVRVCDAASQECPVFHINGRTRLATPTVARRPTIRGQLGSLRMATSAGSPSDRGAAP